MSSTNNLISYIASSIRRGSFWGSAERWLRGSRIPYPMSWAAFYFDAYRRARLKLLPTHNFQNLTCKTTPGLVSIVLPAYNGAAYLSQALDSILAQTYPHWEVIAVDDGSSDETGSILDDYARREARIHVVHQANQQLPGALNTGFGLARGEYLTWLSCDNRLYPNFLHKLLGCLTRHPDWELAYADLDLVDEAGAPILDSPHYLTYQHPFGSSHIHLPAPSELNTTPNNVVGAAFLFRRRVLSLLGPHSPAWVGVEDHDYWMRINELLTLRKADFNQPIYQYRFHARSLTAHKEALRIPAQSSSLLVFDDFRRDQALTPLTWVIDAGPGPSAQDLAAALRWALRRGEPPIQAQASTHPAPGLWPPSVYLVLLQQAAPAPEVKNLPPTCLRVLVNLDLPLSALDLSAWDLVFTAVDFEAVAWDQSGKVLRFTPDLALLVSAIDVAARSRVGMYWEARLQPAPGPRLPASVIVCTNRPPQQLVACLTALAAQTLPPEQFEIIVVNNHPQPGALEGVLAGLNEGLFKDRRPALRQVHCPLPGLSQARNAGLLAAGGEIVCYLDDDAAAAPGWLACLLQAFRQHPQAGVIGGKILLRLPQPPPRWLKPAWKRFWSHFDPPYPAYQAVSAWPEYPWGANWAARRSVLFQVGGFRSRYGRTGQGTAGGEEMIAASLAQRLGWEIGVEPGAVVEHQVAPSRLRRLNIWNSAQSSRRTWIQLQKELYIPFETDLAHSLARLKAGFRRAGAETPLRPLYTLLAEGYLQLQSAIDCCLRLRKPWVK